MRDIDVFDGKSLSDVLKDIYDTAVAKRTIIDEVIEQLTKLIKNSDDASMIAPMLKEFYEVSIKNDDQLVKVATIAQRILSAESYQKLNNGGNFEMFMSQEEKDRLIANASQTIKELKLEEIKVNTDLNLVREKLNASNPNSNSSS